MVQFLIKRPIAVLMITLAGIVLGIAAAARIPTSLIPEIDIPVITVQLSYPNSVARTLETNVVRPLRNQLLQISNLKDVESETRDGFATLKLSFDYGTNTDYAFIETNEKIDASLNYLPKDLERPRVIKASTTDIPVVTLAITLKESYSDERFLELSTFTASVLKKRIEQIPDIALADLNGQTKAEILITPDVLKMQSLGISNAALTKAIRQNNFEIGNLLVQNGIYQYNFKFSNPLRTKEDIENIYLTIHNKIFQLKDLTTVSLTTERDRGLVYHNGKRALVLSIIKQADARMYTLKEKLEELVLSLHKEYPDLLFSTNQDQTKLLKLSIDNLRSSLWIGSVLAILIMFFFLNDLKSPLIIGISIPVSLILSLFLMYLFGLSINIISLSGLILGVGMMIDNAIIVIDNITRKLEQGSNIFIACVQGTNEIITPLISSLLTTCSVFLPLLFLSGITGALFYDQAMAVSIGLGSSFIVSVTLIPVTYKKLREKTLKFEKRFRLHLKIQNIEHLYEKGYHFFFDKKWIVYSISIAGILLAIILTKTMKYSQLPKMNHNETIIDIDWNENINISENQQRTQSILKEIKNIETALVQIGEQQFLLQRENTKSASEASIYLKVRSLNKLTGTKQIIEKKMNTQYPKANISFRPPNTIFEYIFGTGKSSLTAQVYAKNSSALPQEEQLSEIHTLLKNKIASKTPLKETISIHIIQEHLLLYAINYDHLISELKTAFNENFIDHLKTAQEFIPIKLNYDLQGFNDILNGLFVKNENDQLIPVKNLIKVNKTQNYKIITSNRKGEYLGYNIKTDHNPKSQISKIQHTFRNNDNLNVRFSGEWINLKSLKTELILVIGVALLLIYLILAAQFESFRQPLIILMEIPIDIGGALFLLWIFGETINIMAAIGIIVMSGVIINDSILKLHTINQLRKQGLTIQQAIKQGGKLRLKPILMTSLTTILALLPFLFIGGLGAELQKPLGLTVIGGIFTGTFISLYFIPLAYSQFCKENNNTITSS